MKFYRPDDSNMRWRGRNPDGGGPGVDPGTTPGGEPETGGPETVGQYPGKRFRPAFFPGQKGLLAQQMADGFGGTVEEHMGLLSQIYDPMRMPKPFRFGRGLNVDGGNRNKGDGKGKQEPNLPYFYTGNPLVPYTGGR